MNLEYTNLHTMLTQPDIYVSTFTVALGDKLFLGEQDLLKSFGFGVAVAAGSFVGPLIGNYLKLQTLLTKPAHDISFADKAKARALFLRISKQNWRKCCSCVSCQQFNFKEKLSILSITFNSRCRFNGRICTGSI